MKEDLDLDFDDLDSLEDLEDEEEDRLDGLMMEALPEVTIFFKK